MAQARRVALVTGAASGIGAATAAELAARGWIIAGFDLAPAERTDYSVGVDVSDPAQVSAALGRVERELGPVEAVVNAAGHYEMVPVAEISREAWQRMLRVHLGGLSTSAARWCPG